MQQERPSYENTSKKMKINIYKTIFPAYSFGSENWNLTNNHHQKLDIEYRNDILKNSIRNN